MLKITDEKQNCIFRSDSRDLRNLKNEEGSLEQKKKIIFIIHFYSLLISLFFAGPYISFLASTINGYEGTGRSLSLKLLQQLRQQSAGGEVKEGKTATSKGRTLHEMQMEESIRYKPGDKVRFAIFSKF